MGEEYSEINEGNYATAFFEAVNNSDLPKLDYILVKYSNQRSDINKAVHTSIKDQKTKILERLLLRRGFDLTPEGSTDKTNAEALFELAKIGGMEIWNVLTLANSTTEYGRLSGSCLESIAMSGDSSKAIQRSYCYRLSNRDTLEKIEEISSGINLRVLFNFYSCQQTTIAEKDKSISVTVNDFNSFNSKDFFNEMHEIYESLGGERPHPFKINKTKNIKP